MSDSSTPQTLTKRSVLPSGYDVNGYVIRSILGRGGFGITYLAHDTNLDRPVAIKEYLPGDFSVRGKNYTVHPKTEEQRDLFAWGLDRFLAEARTLAKFEHHNIVHVYTVFEKNNTAYMVMRFEQGGDLASGFEQGDYRTQESLLNIVLPILDGLKLVHSSGFIHRDIKPSNIYIRQDASPVLLDFGSARQSLTNTSNLTRLISHSYTPFEQYNDQSADQGPWTDIYAMGATLYYGVSGKLPVDAVTRGTSIIQNRKDNVEKLAQMDLPQFTPEFLDAIDWALAFRQKNRPQNCDEWIAALLGQRTDALDLKHVSEPIVDPDESTVIHKTETSPIRPDSEMSASAKLSNQYPGSSFDNDGTATEAIHSADTELLMTDDFDLRPERIEQFESEFDDQRVNKPRRSNSTVPKVLAALVLGIGIMAFAGYIYYEQSIKPAQATQIEINRLLASANSDIKNAHLIFPEGSSALDKFVSALKSDNENPDTIAGLNNLSGQIDKKLTKMLQDGQLQDTQAWLQRLGQIAPDLEAAPQILATLQLIAQKHTKEFELKRSLGKANARFEQKQYLLPTGDSAAYWYKAALSKQPENDEALAGLNKSIDLAIKGIEKQIARGDIINAKSDLDRLVKFDPPQSDVQLLRNKIKRIEGQRAEKQRQEAQAAREAQEALERELSQLRVEQEGKSSLQIINNMLSEYAEALEQLDVKKLEEITQLRSSTKAILNKIDRRFESVSLSLSNLGIQRNQGRARAVVTIENAIDASGATSSPEDAWRKFTLSMVKKQGVWTKISW